MNQTLTVILPIHNAQLRLTDQIDRLLELLPDLSDRFEILIVDDASTDLTDDVATEMAIVYPQIHVIRHAHQMGIDVAIETGMAHSNGDVVLIHDSHQAIDDSTLMQMWNGRQSLDCLTGHREPQPLREGLLKRLSAWGDSIPRSPTRSDKRPGVSVRRRRIARSSTVAPVRREKSDQIRQPADDSDQSEFVTSSYCTSQF